MLKRKLSYMVISLILMFSLSLTALAADGELQELIAALR
jgi:hypothetical protein